MVSTTFLHPVANRFLLLTNILSTLRIDKLVVPEIIANDLSAVLDCAYAGAADDVNVLWLHNETQVYEWKQGTEPTVSGILDGRLDLTYTVTSASGYVEKRALRVMELTPDLSGQYTCIVRSRGQEARATKSMIVFSPERDFELTFSRPREPGVVDVRCAARRLHPQPDLRLEYNKVPIAQQQQRIWREGLYFDTECAASLFRRDLRPNAEIACRLQLPQVDYTAITKKYLNFGNQINGTSVTILTSTYIIASVFISLCKYYNLKI